MVGENSTNSESPLLAAFYDFSVSQLSRFSQQELWVNVVVLVTCRLSGTVPWFTTRRFIIPATVLKCFCHTHSHEAMSCLFLRGSLSIAILFPLLFRQLLVG